MFLPNITVFYVIAISPCQSNIFQRRCFRCPNSNNFKKQLRSPVGKSDNISKVPRVITIRSNNFLYMLKNFTITEKCNIIIAHNCNAKTNLVSTSTACSHPSFCCPRMHPPPPPCMLCSNRRDGGGGGGWPFATLHLPLTGRGGVLWFKMFSSYTYFIYI
jgi:hypothetical protein